MRKMRLQLFLASEHNTVLESVWGSVSNRVTPRPGNFGVCDCVGRTTKCEMSLLL